MLIEQVARTAVDEPSSEKEQIVQDPVCGVQFPARDAVATEMHDGRTLYFHDEGCHRSYLEHQHRYGHGYYEDDPDDPE